METSVLGIVVSVVVAFLLSGVWYAAWGRTLARLHAAYQPDAARPAATTVGVEVVRNGALALVVAWLAARSGADSVGAGVVLGLVLWVGFPAVLLAGSVWHERVPPALAAIHAGDWLLKLLTVAALVAVF
jgi:hypothetical protein